MSTPDRSRAPERLGAAVRPSGPAALATLLLVAGASCAFVEFEESPYTIRDLQVVYSAQEDLSFFSWRLGADADPDRVRFHLALPGSAGGATGDLDLDAAPFPARPWRCSGGLCFQFQVPGRVSLAENARPLSSVHDAQGTFAGPVPSFTAVDRTFDVTPFSYGRNDRLELSLTDWFDARGIPLRRAFEWQLVAADAVCGAPGADWEPHQKHVRVDRAWTAAPTCLALRPVRRDRPAGHVAVRLEPTAETRRLPRLFLPPEEDVPIVYGVSVDLHIPDAGRCASVQEGLAGLIGAAVEARGTSWRVGPYLPVDLAGAPLDGCEQVARRGLPVLQMIEDVQAVRDHVVAPFRLVWFHLHNLALPPSDEVVRDLGLLYQAATETAGAEPVFVAVAPQGAVGGLPAALTISWRPVSDETLAADLTAFSRDWLPFRTQLHDPETEVPIAPPPGVTPPEAFKLCLPAPAISGMGARAGQTVPWPSVVPWPDPGEPHFTIDLASQVMVPNAEYAVQNVSYVLEVCDALCDRPFRLEDRTVRPSWQDDPECRRIEEGER